MAIQNITPTTLAVNTASANLAITGGTAIVAADTFKIPYKKQGSLVVMLNNTFTGAKQFTFAAGDTGLPQTKQGNLVVSLAQNDVKFIVLDSARFVNKDGTVNLTFESGTTGFVRAVEIL